MIVEMAVIIAALGICLVAIVVSLLLMRFLARRNGPYECCNACGRIVNRWEAYWSRGICYCPKCAETVVTGWAPEGENHNEGRSR